MKCSIYGISVWDIVSDSETRFEDVRIQRPGTLPLEVDRIEIAQFLYLLLTNPNIRHVLDAVTAKAVLILGNFEPKERKPVLEALRHDLRAKGYIPILFDFAASETRDLTETISTLAHLARFVIADLTDARSLPQE